MEFKNKRKLANTYMAYAIAISYFVIFILILVSVFVKSARPVTLTIMVVLLIIGIIADFGFSWMVKTVVEQNNNKIIATVTDIRGDKYIYTINKINKIRRFLTRYYITGDIKQKEPHKKEKDVKKIYLEDCDENTLNLLRSFKNQ